MPRRGSTTQRGYGADHQARARELKAGLVDGAPCCRCGGPMYRWQLGLGRNDIGGIDADHHGRARALGGELPDALAHRRCNRAAGARLGNQLRGRARRGRAGGGSRRRPAEAGHPGRVPAGPLPTW